VFGSPFKNPPTEASCSEHGTCTLVSFIQHLPDSGDPYSGGAPVSGVITSIRYSAYAEGGDGNLTFRLAEVKVDPTDDSNAVAKAVASGPTVNVVDDGNHEPPIKEIAARLPVTKGQHLAVDASESVAIVYNSGGGAESYIFDPSLVDNGPERPSINSTAELLVQATIEPDADGDGFGDETQDQCPRQASTQGACDDTQPAVSGFSVKRGKATYTLSEGATVSFQLSKKLPGRKVGKKCVKQTKGNKKKKKRCTLLRPRGPAFVGPAPSARTRCPCPTAGS
jgi:hypothetical protein